MFDFSLDNLNLPTKEVFLCKYCSSYKLLKEQSTRTCCKVCQYIRELVRYAKSRTKDKKRKTHILCFNLEITQFVNQKVCALTGIPLVFKKGRYLRGASLDRKDSSLGYTSDNVLMICHGLNQLKADKDEKYLKGFIKESKHTKGQPIIYTKWLKKMVQKKSRSYNLPAELL